MTENYDEKIVEDLLYTFSKPSLENLTSMLVRTMQLVGSMKGKTGLEKKTIVVACIREVVDRSDVMGELEPFILEVLPTLIDNLVAIDKNRLVINPRVKGLFSKVLGLLRGCCK